MINEEIIKDISKNIKTADSLVNTIRERSQICDPEIVYSLMELQSLTDKLFKKYGIISSDASLSFRFNEIIKNKETYRGDFARDCICRKHV